MARITHKKQAAWAALKAAPVAAKPSWQRAGARDSSATPRLTSSRRICSPIAAAKAVNPMDDFLRQGRAISPAAKLPDLDDFDAEVKQ